MKSYSKKEKTKNLPSFIQSYFDEITSSIKLVDIDLINASIQVIMNAYKKSKKIYILGNGGSASIASHMACDLGKGTLNRVYDEKEKRLRVISLTDNTPLITAYSNDLGYDSIFLQQLRNLVDKGDVVIAISGSGNSENVIKAVRYAKRAGAFVIGLSGFLKGGKLSKLSDLSIIVKSNHYGPIEDIHMMIGHIIAAQVASLKRKESKSNNTSINNSVPFRT